MSHDDLSPRPAQTVSSQEKRVRDAFLSAAYQSELNRRDALKGFLALAGAAVLFGMPRLASGAEATQETLDALSDAQAEYDAVQTQLDDIAAQYQELSQQQDQTLSDIEDVEGQITATEEQIAEKQAELEQQQEVLAARVSSSYKGGGTNALTLLLSSTSFDELLSNVYYIDKLNQSDREAIAEVTRIQQELEAQKTQLETQKSELEALREQQAQQLTDMQNKQSEVQTVLNNLSAEVQQLMEQRDAEILAAAEAEAEAERQRKAAEEAAAAGGGSNNSSSGISLPEVGSGQDYDAASSAQKRVVNSCYATPSPGANYCAAWVSYVFRNAGFGTVSGNANDMYNNWCTSSNSANLQVGMIIAVSTYSKNYAGRMWGHVGIYIGDNRIMENIGFINTNSLDSWCSYYGDTVTPRWGWAKGIDLSAQ